MEALVRQGRCFQRELLSSVLLHRRTNFGYIISIVIPAKAGTIAGPRPIGVKLRKGA